MANKTLNFGVTLLDPNQAQKDVTVNEALVTFDSFIQPSVISATVSAPPLSPNDQDKYIVPSGATGAWAGQTNNIAVYQANGSVWTFVVPKAGWLIFNQATGVLLTWGTSWAAWAQAPYRGTFTLPANTTSYTVTAAISPAAAYCLTGISDIALFPQTTDASNQIPMATAIAGNAQFVVNCASNGNTDSIFNFRVFN